jgi:transposase
MRATTPRYSEEFKSEALALMDRDQRPFRQLSEDLGVSAWTLRHWYNRREMAKKNKGAKKGRVPMISANESAAERLARLERETKRLQKENDSLRMDREILKKAAAHSTGHRNTMTSDNELREVVRHAGSQARFGRNGEG